MYELDYIMRIIKEIVRTLIKLLFNVDTEMAEERLVEDTESNLLYSELCKLVDGGKMCEAENRLYDLMDSDRNNADLIAVMTYSYMNDKSDEFLIEHNFSRAEVEEGLKRIAQKNGLSGLDDIFRM